MNIDIDIYALFLNFYLKSYVTFKSQYAKKIPDHSEVISEKSKKLAQVLALELIPLVGSSSHLLPEVSHSEPELVENILAFQF